MMLPYDEIEKKLGYAFKNRKLLDTAFTHSTYANRYGVESNERMEYFGDAILGYVVAKYLFLTNRDMQEGEMTKDRSKLVSGENLLSESEELGLRKYLLYEGSERNVGKKTVSSLFESVIAAIWLDGGMDHAESFILRHLKSSDTVNYIGKLQEFLQGQGKPLPDYKEPVQSGTDDRPQFWVEVQADGLKADGEGGRKKEARQVAAKRLLEKLKRKK